MILLQLMKDLTYGELAQLEIGKLIPGEFQSEPDPTKYEQLLTHINLALNEIYMRFFLSSKEIDIQQHAEITHYLLHSDFAESNTASLEDPKYIIDTAETPFQDDILKIEEVYDEEGLKLPLNDTTEDTSLYTPNFRTVQHPYPDDANMFSVQYRASHPVIVYTGQAFDPSVVEIDLPNSLHAACLYYVASRAFASLGGDQGTEGNDYYQRFEAACDRVSTEGLEVQTEHEDFRFDENGWK